VLAEERDHRSLMAYHLGMHSLHIGPMLVPGQGGWLIHHPVAGLERAPEEVVIAAAG
jgi:hypothetical protein